MAIILDGKGLEAARPDSPGGSPLSVVTLRVDREQPVHPGGEVGSNDGTDHQMKVVGHETGRDDLDRATRLRTLNQPQETVEVIRAAEHRSPVIAAIQYVVVQAGMDAACGPWHVVKVGDGPGEGRPPLHGCLVAPDLRQL